MSDATDAAQAIIKKIVFEIVVKVVIQKAVAALPFLAWPVVGPIFGYLVGKFAGLVYDELVKAITFTIIDIQVGAEKKAYEEAVKALKETIDKQWATEEEKNAALKTATEEFKKRFADLIKLKP